MDSGLLAFRANPEEFQFVRYARESISGGDSLFQFPHGAFLNLHNLRAASAHQVVVMPIIILQEQFKTGKTITEIEPLHHAHSLEQMHGAINRSQVAISIGKSGKYFFDRHRVNFSPEKFKDGVAGSGQLPGFSPQPIS